MTQKNKNIILIVSLILIACIAYRYSVAKTIAIVGEVKKLEHKKKVYQSAPAQLATLINKEKKLNEILKKNNVEGNSVQNNLLKTLNKLSEDIGFMIIAFEEPHSFTDKTTQKITTTYNFNIQGDYKSFIKVLHALEQKYSYGNVIHVNFEKKKNFRTRKQFLQCQVLLQRLN